MQRHNLLHPNHARRIASAQRKQQEIIFNAPDIFIVPPEEDQIPPWCCYNAQQDASTEDDYDHFARYPPVPAYTSYFPATAPGLEDFIPSRSKGSSETRSIVDALGDADDYLDNESDHEHIGAVLEDEDGDEFGLYSRSHQESHGQRAYSTEPQSPQREVGNDSDVVEIVRVRRRAVDYDNNDDDFFGPSGNDYNTGPSTKSSFRSRATKAFRSIRGTIRSSSKPSLRYKDSVGPHTKLQLPSKPHSKLQAKPRAQDIFAPTENAPHPRTADTPDVYNQQSSSRSQLSLPALKRRPSSPFFTPSSREPPVTPQDTQDTTPVHSISPPATPVQYTSSSSRARHGPAGQEVDNFSTPTRNSYKRSASTQSQLTSGVQEAEFETSSRSKSPSPRRRASSPSPLARQASRSFSVLNLHKIFHKPTTSTSSEIPASSINSASSTCPSLSSTSTSEWSGPATPPIGSLPSTPTSLASGNSTDQQFSERTPIIGTSSSAHSAGSSECTVNGRATGEPSVSVTPISQIDLSPKVAPNLDLGLDIHLSPTPNRGMHTSRAANKSKVRRGASLSRSLSLKNIGAKLRLGKQAPPVPPLPVSAPPDEADPDFEMRLDSFHFDDLSFDTDRFVSR